MVPNMPYPSFHAKTTVVFPVFRWSWEAFCFTISVYCYNNTVLWHVFHKACNVQVKPFECSNLLACCKTILRVDLLSLKVNVWGYVLLPAQPTWKAAEKDYAANAPSAVICSAVPFLCCTIAERLPRHGTECLRLTAVRQYSCVKLSAS